MPSFSSSSLSSFLPSINVLLFYVIGGFIVYVLLSTYAFSFSTRVEKLEGMSRGDVTLSPFTSYRFVVLENSVVILDFPPKKLVVDPIHRIE